MKTPSPYNLLAKTIAMLSADAVQKANSGHPGLPMGAAGYSSVLWADFLKFNPEEPGWINRDRFVLSAGHGSMLLYSLLNLFGYDVTLEDIKNFRQWNSKTPGHPEFGMTTGVECTTGPLGQGFANSVGLALSGKMLQETYSKELFDYKVYALVSDGDVMEGVAAEAASLAGHLGLNNLIYLYDDNKISLAAETKICFTEDVSKRMESYGWYVQSVDAADTAEFRKCIENAHKQTEKPSFISVKSIIGCGSPNKQNSADAHGSPLGEAELKLTKENLEWPVEQKFYIPEEISSFCKEKIADKKKEFNIWQQKFTQWQSKNPELAAKLSSQISREIPGKLKEELSSGLGHSKKEATRSLSGKAIQIIAKHLPYFTGGSADLDPSTKTAIKDSPAIQKGNYKGRNIHFGVREHAMGSAANGLAYTRAWVPFTATFLVFADYMRPTIRLAALSHLQTLFIFTHDSFWVGEDGPTHQPVEQIESLRIIPNLDVYRPCDGVEVGMSYYSALTHQSNPSALIFSRQDLPPIERHSKFLPDDVLKGGYIVRQAEHSEKFSLIATGSEVALAIEVAKELEGQGLGARVVSIPCIEIFLKQSKSYQEDVLGKSMKRITLEAGVTAGWASVVGSDSINIGVDRYGASAPGEVVADKFGMTVKGVLKKLL